MLVSCDPSDFSLPFLIGVVAKHELHHNNHMICSAIASKVGVLFPNLYSREKLVTAGGKASASPAVGASPVIPGA